MKSRFVFFHSIRALQLGGQRSPAGSRLLDSVRSGGLPYALSRIAGQGSGRGADSGNAVRDGPGAARPTLRQGYGGSSQCGWDVSALMF